MSRRIREAGESVPLWAGVPRRGVAPSKPRSSRLTAPLPPRHDPGPRHKRDHTDDGVIRDDHGDRNPLSRYSLTAGEGFIK